MGSNRKSEKLPKIIIPDLLIKKIENSEYEGDESA
jgi:hypothetical protein